MVDCNSATAPQEPRRLLLAGGGTGGHVFPGVAIAEAVRRRDPGVAVTFLGTRDGLEARIIPPLGYALRFLPAAPLANQSILGRLRGAIGLARTLLPACAALNNAHPDLVVALGRYASGVPGLLAALGRRRLVLLELNTYPGLANRILARLATSALIAFDEARPHLAGLECENLGVPLRRELVRAARGFRRTAPLDRPLRVFVAGGSGGASALNQAVPPALCRLAGAGVRLEVLHQAGLGKLAEVAGRYDRLGPAAGAVEFLDEIGAAYAWADLLISRAGGCTLAEAQAFGLPAIYVPLVTRDRHQERNAATVAERGAAWLVPEGELGGGRLESLVGTLAGDPAPLERAQASAAALARLDAAEKVAARLLELLYRPRSGSQRRAASA